MKILIIEDEYNNAERLNRILDEITEIDTQVLSITSSNTETISFFSKTSVMPDVILSDIQLGDGVSFSALQYAPENTPVIFTTAYDQYAINAFKYNGIAYLLKPIDKQELTEALLRVKERTNTESIHSMLSSLIENGMRYRERFLVPYRNELRVINVQEVSHIGLIERCVYLFTNNNKQYSLSQTLEELESELNPTRFMRVNRQYIVNIGAIDSLSASFLGKMKLRIVNYPKTEVIISRAKVSLVKKWLDS
ncbi:MAG: response regulator transcription factor [Bacteroidales bacterium]|nr:response regulator transcription factor [Candidatus Scybalousia scybalohippi]